MKHGSIKVKVASIFLVVRMEQESGRRVYVEILNKNVHWLCSCEWNGMKTILVVDRNVGNTTVFSNCNYPYRCIKSLLKPIFLLIEIL